MISGPGEHVALTGGRLARTPTSFPMRLDLTPLDLAVPAVARRVLAIQRAAYRVEAVIIGDDRIPPLQEPIAALVASSESFIGAHVDDILAGVVSYRVVDGVLDVHRLAVDPAFARRGLGRALLRHVLDGPGAGSRAVVVATGALNAPARSLYGSLGFAVVGEHEPAPGLRIVQLRLER